MTTKKILNHLFNEKGHLNEEGVSLYSDASIKNKLDKLPPKLLEHVEDCLMCKKEIIELYDIVNEIDKIEKPKLVKSRTFRLHAYIQSYKLAAAFAGLAKGPRRLKTVLKPRAFRIG